MAAKILHAIIIPFIQKAFRSVSAESMHVRRSQTLSQVTVNDAYDDDDRHASYGCNGEYQPAIFESPVDHVTKKDRTRMFVLGFRTVAMTTVARGNG